MGASAQTARFNASRVQLEGRQIVWSGGLDDSGLLQLNKLLHDFSIDSIVFRNVSGGTRGVTRQLIKIVSGNKISTAAEGACLSACALVFLAGTNRKLNANGQGQPTTIAIHGFYDSADDHLIPPSHDEIMYLVIRTRGKITEELAQKALSTNHKGGLFVFERPMPVSGGTSYTSAVLCDFDGAGKLFCIPIPGANASSLGLTQ